MRSTRVLMAVVAAGAIGLAACGGDNSYTSSTAAPAAAAATTAAASATTAAATATTTATTIGADAYGGGYGPAPTTAAPAAASSASTTITLSDTSHGKVLADAQGRTLYIFTKDSNGTSACTDACAKAWPPATATGTPTAATGISAKLSTIARADGSTQVAINGQPLYTYAGDGAPGDTEGQGTSQIWWVVGADGTAIKS
jgi:predicted lipoprotein with Yx(FWY)xxD motif